MRVEPSPEEPAGPNARGLIPRKGDLCCNRLFEPICGTGMVIAGTVIILGDNGKLCRTAVVFSDFFSAALAFDRDLWYNITVKLKCLFQAGVWA